MRHTLGTDALHHTLSRSRLVLAVALALALPRHAVAQVPEAPAPPAAPVAPVAPAAPVTPVAPVAPATPALPTTPSAGIDGRLAEARALVAAGRFDKAFELLDAMLASHEGDQDSARILLSEAQVKAGVPERAVETLDALSSGKSYDALAAAGRAYRALGDKFAKTGRRQDDISFAYDEARSYLELAARAAPPGDHVIADELARFELYTLGDFDAALSTASSRITADPADAEALLLRGCAGVYAVVAAQDAGNEPRAATLAATAISDLIAADTLLPKDRYEPWVQLTWLYESQGQAANAVNAALKVLDRFPKGDFTTLYHLAKRYADERKYDAASHALLEMTHRDAAQLGRLIGAESDKTAVATSLGYAVEPLANARPPRAGDAADILAAILAVQTSDGNLWNNYGLVCRDANRFEESWRGYSEALKLLPDEPGVHNDAAVILHYYLHRDYGRAQELYERALELSEAELATAGLNADRRAAMEIVKRDASTNLEKLARKDYQWNG